MDMRNPDGLMPEGNVKPAPVARDNDIALDITELREKLNLMLAINKRISIKAPQVGKAIREQLNMLERFTARYK